MGDPDSVSCESDSPLLEPALTQEFRDDLVLPPIARQPSRPQKKGGAGVQKAGPSAPRPDNAGRISVRFPTVRNASAYQLQSHDSQGICSQSPRVRGSESTRWNSGLPRGAFPDDLRVFRERTSQDHHVLHNEQESFDCASDDSEGNSPANQSYLWMTPQRSISSKYSQWAHASKSSLATNGSLNGPCSHQGPGTSAARPPTTTKRLGDVIVQYADGEALEPIYPSPTQGFIQSVVAKLSPSADWKDQFDGLTDLRRLARHHSSCLVATDAVGTKTTRKSAAQPILYQVSLYLVQLVDNLRSNVAKNAMLGVHDLYFHLPYAMSDPVILEKMLGVCLRKAGTPGAGNFLIVEAEKSLRQLCLSVPTEARLTGYLLKALREAKQNQRLKASIGQCLCLVVFKLNESITQAIGTKDLNCLISACLKLAAEASPLSRRFGRFAICLLYQYLADVDYIKLRQILSEAELKEFTVSVRLASKGIDVSSLLGEPVSLPAVGVRSINVPSSRQPTPSRALRGNAVTIKPVATAALESPPRQSVLVTPRPASPRPLTPQPRARLPTVDKTRSSTPVGRSGLPSSQTACRRLRSVTPISLHSAARSITPERVSIMPHPVPSADERRGSHMASTPPGLSEQPDAERRAWTPTPAIRAAAPKEGFSSVARRSYRNSSTTPQRQNSESRRRRDPLPSNDSSLDRWQSALGSRKRDQITAQPVLARVRTSPGESRRTGSYQKDGSDEFGAVNSRGGAVGVRYAADFASIKPKGIPVQVERFPKSSPPMPDNMTGESHEASLGSGQSFGSFESRGKLNQELQKSDETFGSDDGFPLWRPQVPSAKAHGNAKATDQLFRRLAPLDELAADGSQEAGNKQFKANAARDTRILSIGVAARPSVGGALNIAQRSGSAPRVAGKCLLDDGGVHEPINQGRRVTIQKPEMNDQYPVLGSAIRVVCKRGDESDVYPMPSGRSNADSLRQTSAAQTTRSAGRKDIGMTPFTARGSVSPSSTRLPGKIRIAGSKSIAKGNCFPIATDSMRPRPLHDSFM